MIVEKTIEVRTNKFFAVLEASKKMKPRIRSIGGYYVYQGPIPSITDVVEFTNELLKAEQQLIEDCCK